MSRHSGMFRITSMCRVLRVSRSGFYAWRAHQQRPSARERRRSVLDDRVRRVFGARKGRSGSPGLTRDLREQGHAYDRKTVAANLLAQDFSAEAPNQKWVGDITYLWTEEGWLYLAVVIDLYSRRVVGWSLSERMSATLVCDALQMALWRRQMPTDVLVHTDRGSQYCSTAYQALLSKQGLICSMSATGNCYDNACAESFFHTLKVEATHGMRFTTRQQMKQTVFEYIEVDYNRTRRHSANGYISPTAFEAKRVA